MRTAMLGAFRCHHVNRREMVVSLMHCVGPDLLRLTTGSVEKIAA